MTQSTPKGMRLHIGLFGRRNVGKSSLLNALTHQSAAIVSSVAGTTTDPVEKPMELQPIGPVLFIDTAGIDDEGALGEQRIARTRQVFDRTDVALLVVEAGAWSPFEDQVLSTLRERNTPVIVVFNKCDLGEPTVEAQDRVAQENIPAVKTTASSGSGVDELRKALIRTTPSAFLDNPAIAGDLVPPGSLVVMVVPIDLEAPKGRLILPQVQTLRDILDNDSYCMVVKERELRHAIDRLREPPALVVTDSQGFLKVAADTPQSVPLTSFSILFARFKGDLMAFTEGALAIESLRPGDRVLISESCGHHPIAEDIGRVKIPRWLGQYVGGPLEITHVQGHDFPTDLAEYRLVVQCGSCTQNRREVLTRVERCREAGVPITNYGMTIAYSLGIFERALGPFPAALELYRHLAAART